MRFVTFNRFQESLASAVDFGLSQEVLPVAHWTGSATDLAHLTGRLTLNGEPVANAQLQAGAYRLPDPTDPAGTFELLRDQTTLERAVLTVTPTDQTEVGGALLTEEQETALAAAQTEVNTAYVITLDEPPPLPVGATNVTLTGRLTFADGETPAPTVRVWGYVLSGVVLDLDGQPIDGAVVSVSDDEGETWALSTTTGPDGVYALSYFPLPDSPYEVRIALGPDLAVSDEEVQFPPETSARLDVVLDATALRVLGTTEDGSLQPESVPGAEYSGYLVGLAVGDRPVTAALTWPDATGVFQVTVPEVTTAEPMTFFEASLRFFSAETVQPGGVVGAGIVPETLAPAMPRGLPPVLTP